MLSYSLFKCILTDIMPFMLLIVNETSAVASFTCTWLSKQCLNAPPTAVSQFLTSFITITQASGKQCGPSRDTCTYRHTKVVKGGLMNFH